MHDPRFRLINGPLLRRLMQYPEAGGTRHTVRSLAEATGISKSKIAYMTKGEKTIVNAAAAAAIARAVGVSPEALFLPLTFAFANADKEQV